ncbi:MAG: hypothetical protein PVF95_13845 [bacterium]|jgi:hypothetical protein
MNNRYAVVAFMGIVFLAVGGPAQASAPDLDWQVEYGNGRADIGYSIIKHSTGGYAVCGYEDFDESGDSDAFLMRLDDNGDTLWVRSYGDSLVQLAQCVRETHDRGYILAGYTERIPNRDALFIRTDEAGDTLWTCNVDLGGDDYITCVLETSDMGFIGAGYTNSFSNPGDVQILAVKVDRYGSVEWRESYGGATQNRAHDICSTRDDNCAITGFTDTATGQRDVLIMKIDAGSGDSLWAAGYGYETTEVGHCIRETAQGHLVVCGSRADVPQGWSDGYVLEVDADGDSLNSLSYGTVEDRIIFYSMAITGDQGFIFAGQIDTSSVYNNDVYFVKTDPGGDVQWSKMVGDANREYARCVAISDDLGYVAAGYTEDAVTFNRDIYIVKLRSDDAGIEPSRERGAAALLEADGPSPSRGPVTLRYQIPAADQVRLAVYDVKGRLLETLVDTRLAAGEYRSSWSCTGRAGPAAPGVYFFRLQAGRADITRKAVILR